MIHRRVLLRLRAHVASMLLAAAVASPARAQYQLEPAWPGLQFVYPTDIQPAADNTNRMFVLEKRGYVWVFDNDEFGNPYRLAAVYEGGKRVRFHPPVPGWLEPLLPR